MKDSCRCGGWKKPGYGPPVRPSCGCELSSLPSPQPGGGFLMQKILASGKLHRRRTCYSLCLEDVSCSPSSSLSVAEVTVDGSPQWVETPCHERGAVLLTVRLPLLLRLVDGCGQSCFARSSLEETLRLRLSCLEDARWRGSLFVQGAVRLCGGCCSCEAMDCTVPLEVLLEGYILSCCPMGAGPCSPPCPDDRPWYPQPRFNPYNER